MTRIEGRKLLSAFCLMLGSFPVWYWFSIWKRLPEWSAFAWTGAGMLLTVLAWVHQKYGAPLEQKSLLLTGLLARAVMLLIGAGSYLLLRTFLNLAGAIVGAVLFGLLYLFFWELLHLPERALLSVYAFILICTAYVVSRILCWLQSGAALGAVCYDMLAGTAILFIFLKNRMMLADAASHHALPAGCYRHNAGILSLFLLPGLLVFAFGEKIAEGIGWLLKTIGIWFLRVLQWAAILFFGKSLFPDTTSMPARNPAYRQNPVLTAVISLVIIGLLVGFLIRFRREFLDYLLWLGERLLSSLRRLMKLKAPAPVQELHQEYTDSVELLDSSRTASHRMPRQLSWKKRFRRYRHMQASPEKYREGYALWLGALQIWKTELSPQDTPEKILQKSAGIPDPELTKSVTAVYYQVRYGNYRPTETEFRELETLVQMIRHSL